MSRQEEFISYLNGRELINKKPIDWVLLHLGAVININSLISRT